MANNEPLHVLQSVSFLHRAGLETMLMNYYRHMDRDKVQFDFLINKNIIGAYEEEVKELGGKLYRTPGYNPIKIFKYKKYMKELFLKHPEIRIVHGHNDLAYVPLMCAKKAGVKVRINHSHNTRLDKGVKYPIKEMCRRNIKKAANYYWGCSIAAIEFFYGKDIIEANNYLLLRNAIEIERFIYNDQVRQRIRKEYNISDKLVIGHVGRFTYQKNHERLLEIFKTITKLRDDACLLLIGEGELESNIKERARELQIEDKILWLGSRDNVNEIYQGMDAFVMPSWYEGLPVVGIEAQASGLPCFFSDVITEETKVVDFAKFISLEESDDNWAKQIVDMVKNHKRTDVSEKITLAGYNIKEEAKKLQQLYLDMAKE